MRWVSEVFGRRRPKGAHGAAARVRDAHVRLLRLAAILGIWGVTVVTDAVPARWRFGHWNRLLAMLAMRSGLPSVASPTALADSGRTPITRASPEPARVSRERLVRCALVAGEMDSGGVEVVVEMLALGLPAHGFHVSVIATSEGAVARRLSESGVRVVLADPEMTASELREHAPDVIQLHRVDPQFVTPLLPFGERVVPVFHALESYLDDAAWRDIAELIKGAPSTIAVSDTVSGFVTDRTGQFQLETVVNGVRANERGLMPRSNARALVAHAVPHLENDDFLIVGLQRYSDQKNAAGLVDAFLLAAESEPRLRLVLAGSPSSWLEVRRADVLRRAHDQGARVHLLGESDPWVLLAAADAYALNSFSEGGPISALEAVSLGLPVVLSDVGFTRQLVEGADSWGQVVPGSLSGASQRDLARARRQRHQQNRVEFAQALVAASRAPRLENAATPECFTEATMVARHAAILRAAAGL